MSKPFRWPETQTDPRTGIYEAFVDQTKKEIKKLLRDDQVNGEMRKLIREGGWHLYRGLHEMSKPFRWSKHRKRIRKMIEQTSVDQVKAEMRKLIREDGCRPPIQAMTIRKMNAYIDEIARFTVAR